MKKYFGFQVGIESVKTAADVYTPVAGEVTEVNKTLETPETLSASPESDAWLIKLKYKDGSSLESLLDQKAYDEFLKEQAH